MRKLSFSSNCSSSSSNGSSSRNSRWCCGCRLKSLLLRMQQQHSGCSSSSIVRCTRSCSSIHQMQWGYQLGFLRKRKTGLFSSSRTSTQSSSSSSSNSSSNSSSSSSSSRRWKRKMIEAHILAQRIFGIFIDITLFGAPSKRVTGDPLSLPPSPFLLEIHPKGQSEKATE
ncbi:hypothetical protein Emag_000322 [Eimeria magna]